MRTPLRTALAVLLCLAALSSADASAADGCRERVYDLLKQAYPGAASETGDDGELLRTAGANPRWIDVEHGAICKVWPAEPDKTLLAVQLGHEAAINPNGATADLELLIVDSAQPRILQRYRQDDALVSDAVRVGALILDTARYRLNEDTTAFGLRIEYIGSSRANPYGATVLNLYAIRDGALRPVLQGLEVALSRGVWDTNCAGEFSSVRRTVAIDAKRDHGYAGLLVNSAEESSRAVVDGKDCKEKNVVKNKSSVRVAFDGREYVVPKSLRGL
ncbi:hypothetical protein [Pseudomonas sp. CGJS7]|uniref:hypothetical protein n=1 Tax=Pseudomonas sp. CGJS7 TaxID=3109348 RepID=UPI003008D44D